MCVCVCVRVGAIMVLCVMANDVVIKELLACMVPCFAPNITRLLFVTLAYCHLSDTL